MNDFEWRRQLRDLRQPEAPQRDLWAGIERSLEAGPMAEASQPGIHRRAHSSWWLAAGLAAVTVLAVGLNRPSMQADLANPTVAAVTPWKPADPRLAGAAIELTAAQIELRQAIQQAPDSTALQRLLNRTEQQQARLRRLGQDAG